MEVNPSTRYRDAVQGEPTDAASKEAIEESHPSRVDSALGKQAAFWGPQPTPVFTNLARISLFLEALQRECLDPVGVSFGDYAVLRVLEHVGRDAPMSPTQLAEIVVRTTGGMTKTIDRLERQGYVSREPDPVDRRRVLVRLAPTGEQLCEAAAQAYSAVRNRLLAQLSESQITELDESLMRLLQLFESDRSREEP